MFTSDVSEPYETLRRGDLTVRQRLDQLLNNIDLQHGSAANMLQRMREVVGQRIFDDGLLKQLFLSKLPQQVQVVLASFQNNVLDYLSAYADRILEITKSFDSEFFQSKRCLKRARVTLQSYVIHLHVISNFVTTANGHIPCEEALHVGDLPLDHGRRITPAGAGIIISMESLPEIAENPAIFPSQNQLTRKHNSGNFQAGTR
ncbi:unnamed protein product [Schistosoma margrebowiei]|uniref:Uncharacterized protein n=1 Tax=Schistosoma margrebowiei TaxID=48269 RepID=A0A183MME0_9TREM|nr:unnamed protein product [Schistosoma margrebowiei]